MAKGMTMVLGDGNGKKTKPKGMKIGYLGDVVFQTSDKKILTFKDFVQEASAEWANHNRQGKKPLSEFVAPNLETGELTIYLLATEGVKPRKLKTKLMRYCLNGRVVPFYIGGKKVGLGSGKYKILNVRSGWEEIMNGGELLACSVDLTLEEYVAGKKAKKTKKGAKKSAKEKADKNAKHTTHKVVKGDTLWDLSKKYLGSGTRKNEIYNLNKDVLKSPSDLRVGQVLKIPKK